MMSKKTDGRSGELSQKYQSDRFYAVRDWGEYDFEFMLFVKDGEGGVMKMTEYLKLSNTGNCMGLRLDTMRLMMLPKDQKQH